MLPFFPLKRKRYPAYANEKQHTLVCAVTAGYGAQVDEQPLLAVGISARTQTEQSDERLLKGDGAGVVEERPRDEAQQDGCSEVRVGGAASLDQLLQHSARIFADLIQHGGLLNTGDAAEGRAFFDDGVLALDVLVGVVNEWDAGVAALLRAPMDKSILADIEEPRAGAAVPGIGQTADEVFLETVVVGEGEDAGFEPPDLLINAELAFGKSAALPGAVMGNTHGAVESEGAGTAGDSEGILRVLHGDARGTELIVTANSASRASHSSFRSRTRKDFMEVSSGSTLSMLIWR